MILWQSGLLQIGISHFNHDREFIFGPRGFKIVEEMNSEIVRRHNELVASDDDVYVLGDLSLGGGGDEVLARAKELIESLNGRIHIILGNHDTPKRIEMYKSCKNVVDSPKYADMLHYKGYHFYLSHFPTITSNHDEDKSLKARIINLCGHKHTTDKFIDFDKGIIYHVELDSHNCYPKSIDDIIKDIKYFGQN